MIGMWPFKKKLPDSDKLDQSRLESFGVLAFVSSLCVGPGRLFVKHGVREKPNNISDSGWILNSGSETQAYANDPKNYKLVPLEMMIKDDATLAPLRSFSVGTEITRTAREEPWRYIVENEVVDEDGKKVGCL